MRFLRTYKLFESLRGKLRYLGPNPTADTIVTRTVNGQRQVLLVQRSKWVSAEPNKWSIPGGFVDTLSDRGKKWQEGYETPLMAAKREVLEETGLDLSEISDGNFKLIGIYDDMGRDPRNTEESWVKSHSFTVDIPGNMGEDVRGMDDAQDAKWFTLDELNQMNKEDFAFDHINRLIELGLFLNSYENNICCSCSGSFFSMFHRFNINVNTNII